MNSNVPHFRSLVSVSCIEIIVQVKRVILFSVRSNKHTMAPLSALCERSDYKLVHLNSRSYMYKGEIVQLQSALNHETIQQFSGKIKHVPHFRAHNWKIFSKPCTSLQNIFIDPFSSAKKRCNTSQGFRTSFGQSCDRNRFLFPFMSWTFSLFSSLS